MAHADHQGSQADRRGRQRRIRVLLVEDDADLRLMLALALKAEGYDVTATSRADEALGVLSRRRHDLILTDYWLPQKDGVQFLEEARSRGVLGESPVIVCSAFPPSGAPNATIVSKPIELDQLMGRIRSMVRR